MQYEEIHIDNYLDENVKHVNMLAFNLHDVCKKEKKKLVEAFKNAYTPFLQNWLKLNSTFNPLNGGRSRKKRNLKKKKSKKKSKRHRRKTRKL